MNRESIRIRTSIEGLGPDHLFGFFVGWPQPPSPQMRRAGRKVIRKAIGKQLRYIDRNLGTINELAGELFDGRLMLLSRRAYRNLLVAHEVYRQQKRAPPVYLRQPYWDRGFAFLQRNPRTLVVVVYEVGEQWSPHRLRLFARVMAISAQREMSSLLLSTTCGSHR